MTRLFLLVICALAGVYAPPAAAQSAPGGRRPNVLVIVADDLGYSDLGCYGGEIKTPNLDALAKDGVRFTGLYNAARCCPTRASLLTGLYQHQAGIGGMTTPTPNPPRGYIGHLRPTDPTVAEVLKAAGYRTALFGKWHVGDTVEGPDHRAVLNRQQIPDRFVPDAQHPLHRGFDTYWGALWGLVNFYNPFSLSDGMTPVKELPEKFYMTDAINDHAAAYIRGRKAADPPFFMYLAHNAPHWPLHALPEDIAKYEGQYADGYDSVRRARYERMVAMGLIDPKTAPLPPTLGKGWDGLDDQTKRFRARLFRTHAAMIDRMDRGLGDVLQAVKDRGEWDDTLIFFFSDNGASPEEPYGPGFDRPDTARDGRRIVHDYKDKSLLAGGEHTFFHIGRDWANVANTPFRRAKASQFNGGERSPMIVHWPAGLKMPAGSFVPARAHVIDIMPTILAATGTAMPTTFAGETPHALQGVSLMPLLRGENSITDYPAIYGEHEGGRSVLTPDGYKLIKDRGENAWKLFDLNADLTENDDLGQTQPDRVEKMRAMWDAWAQENYVLPKP